MTDWRDKSAVRLRLDKQPARGSRGMVGTTFDIAAMGFGSADARRRHPHRVGRRHGAPGNPLRSLSVHPANESAPHAVTCLVP